MFRLLHLVFLDFTQLTLNLCGYVYERSEIQTRSVMHTEMYTNTRTQHEEVE